jgi:hypothetical protein
MGYIGSFATFLKGVWNTASFKGVAIIGTAMSAGVLAIGVWQTRDVGRAAAPTPRVSASPNYTKPPPEQEGSRTEAAAVSPRQNGSAADPIDSYRLTPEAGPLMVLARVFRGPDAQRLAIALAEELRSDYGMPAYIFGKEDLLGRTRSALPQARREERAPDVKSPEKVRRVVEVAVLVGDEKSMAGQDKLWRKVKKIQPRCLEKIPRRFPMRNSLATAIRTTNPYLRAEVPDPVDPPASQKVIMQMNMGPRSIINCPGRYSLQVAEFDPRFTDELNPELTHAQNLAKLKKSPVHSAHDDAERLAERLAKASEIRTLAQPIYVFHDRSASKVFIGAFDSPQEPQALAIRNQLIRAVETISNNDENGRNAIDMMINPAHDLTDLSEIKAAIRN